MSILSPKMVDCTNLDSIRIDVLGCGRAVQIPSELLLAIDDVLRAAVEEEEELMILRSEDDDSGWTGWTAYLGNWNARGASTWEAVKNLADKLQWDGKRVCGRGRKRDV